MMTKSVYSFVCGFLVFSMLLIVLAPIPIQAAEYPERPITLLARPMLLSQG